MEFWGTISSRTISLKSRLRLLVVVFASVFLAAIAGPSSAILLVPRLDYWPGGSTDIWINVTSDSLWPSSTNASEVPTQCLDASTSDIYNFVCPSHGWAAIQDYIFTAVNSVDPKYRDLLGIVDPPLWVATTGHGSQRRLLINTITYPDDGSGYDLQPVAESVQQSVVADALTETGQLWTSAMENASTNGHGSILQEQDAVHAIKNGYYQPYTIVSCATDVIRGPYDNSSVAFPVPPGVQPRMMLNQTELNDSVLDIYSFVYHGITRRDILGTPGPLKQSRLKWVELPQDPFNGSAIGAVISLPRSAVNSTQDIVICTLGAGWGSTIINTSTFSGGTTFTTSVVDDPGSTIWSSEPFNVDEDAINEKSGVAENEATSTLMDFDLPFYPEKPVIVTEAWATYLNPYLPALNTTVIDALMSTNSPAGELSPEQQLTTADWALAGLLANGLASIGAGGRLQGDIKTVSASNESIGWDGNYWFSGKGDIFTVDPEQSKDWVKLRVDSTIEGYAYNIRGTSPKIAITFLLIYCVIAISHVLYAGISGISSTCWDSIGEVTALAMNSTPTTLLKNTCAGILELNIFKIPVRVLAFRDDEAGDGEHLELVFGDVDEKNIREKNIRGTPIKPNRVYGTLPKMAKKEKSE